MVSITMLKQRLPESSVPTSLGGTLVVDHPAWLNQCLASYEADGVVDVSIESVSQAKRAVSADELLYDVPGSHAQLLVTTEQALVSEGGMSCLEFVEHMRKKGKNGLKFEYNMLRNEPEEGLYEATRYVNMILGIVGNNLHQILYVSAYKCTMEC